MEGKKRHVHACQRGGSEKNHQLSFKNYIKHCKAFCLFYCVWEQSSPGKLHLSMKETIHHSHGDLSKIPLSTAWTFFSVFSTSLPAWRNLFQQGGSSAEDGSSQAVLGSSDQRKVLASLSFLNSEKIPAMLYVGKGPVLRPSLSLFFLSFPVCGVLCLVKFTGGFINIKEKITIMVMKNHSKSNLKYLLVFVELHLLSLLNPKRSPLWWWRIIQKAT